MRRTSGVACLLALAGGLVLQGGCYERVVGAEGVGTDDVDTYEANAPEEEPKGEADMPIMDGRSPPD